MDSYDVSDIAIGFLASIDLNDLSDIVISDSELFWTMILSSPLTWEVIISVSVGPLM
jgi:hypothetical protein